MDLVFQGLVSIALFVGIYGLGYRQGSKDMRRRMDLDTWGTP